MRELEIEEQFCPLCRQRYGDHLRCEDGFTGCPVPGPVDTGDCG
jgi:hypothetical protein